MPRYETRDGQELYYKDVGQGEPVVLLHGFGMHSGHWFPYSWMLSKKCRIIAPDLRGFGRSHHANLSSDCCAQNFADDLEDLLDHLKLEQAKLIGISMGALTSLQYFKSYGEDRFKSYMHIDQSPCCENSDEWNWGLFGKDQKHRFERAKALMEELKPYIEQRADFHQIPKTLRHKVRFELGEFFASALSKTHHKQAARFIMKFEPIASKIMPIRNWSVYIQCLQAYLEKGYDLRDAFEGLDIPVHVMVGMRSELYPAAGQLRMADYHHNSYIIPFTRSGHAPLIDQPLKFAQTLMRFSTA